MMEIDHLLWEILLQSSIDIALHDLKGKLEKFTLLEDVRIKQRAIAFTTFT